MERFGIWILLFLSLSEVTNGYTRSSREITAEKKIGSFLIQKVNKREYSRLQDLLGMPIGDAKTAAATNGTVKKTKYMPKCPENISAVPEESVKLFLKRCPSLQKKEYRKQEKQVANLIINSTNLPAKNYDKQKKDLISAVNRLANAAGSLPSLS